MKRSQNNRFAYETIWRFYYARKNIKLWLLLLFVYSLSKNYFEKTASEKRLYLYNFS